jgi:hypothetical protein
MRPLTRPAGNSCTTTFPIRNRASSTVSLGNSARRNRRMTLFFANLFGVPKE